MEGSGVAAMKIMEPNNEEEIQSHLALVKDAVISLGLVTGEKWTEGRWEQQLAWERERLDKVSSIIVSIEPSMRYLVTATTADASFPSVMKLQYLAGEVVGMLEDHIEKLVAEHDPANSKKMNLEEELRSIHTKARQLQAIETALKEREMVLRLREIELQHQEAFMDSEFKRLGITPPASEETVPEAGAPSSALSVPSPPSAEEVAPTEPAPGEVGGAGETPAPPLSSESISFRQSLARVESLIRKHGDTKGKHELLGGVSIGKKRHHMRLARRGGKVMSPADDIRLKDEANDDVWLEQMLGGENIGNGEGVAIKDVSKVVGEKSKLVVPSPQDYYDDTLTNLQGSTQ